jgi:hypothetical protein
MLFLSSEGEPALTLTLTQYAEEALERRQGQSV